MEVTPFAMRARFLLPLIMVGASLLTGCGESSSSAPPPSATRPPSGPPPKVPTTVDEKIQAIQNSSMPEAQKKQEIDKVKAGSL